VAILSTRLPLDLLPMSFLIVLVIYDAPFVFSSAKQVAQERCARDALCWPARASFFPLVPRLLFSQVPNTFISCADRNGGTEDGPIPCHGPLSLLILTVPKASEGCVLDVMPRTLAQLILFIDSPPPGIRNVSKLSFF